VAPEKGQKTRLLIRVNRTTQPARTRPTPDSHPTHTRPHRHDHIPGDAEDAAEEIWAPSAV